MKRALILTFIAVVLAAVGSIATVAADGDLDLTFNGTGKARFGFGFGEDRFNGIAIQPDGKIVTVGFMQDGRSASEFSLARYNADGSLDITFGERGIARPRFGSFWGGVFHAVAIQPDGKIVAAGGHISSTATGTDFAVARFNPDGSTDTTFDADGLATAAFASASRDDIARAVAIQPDGKIVLAGVARPVSTATNFGLARFNEDGSIDTSFDGDGKLTTSIVASDDANSVAIQSDGKIVAAGLTGTGDIDFCLVRYNADGTLDTGFDGDGKRTTSFTSGGDRAYAVVIQSDDRILVAGSAGSSTVPGLDFAAARYNSDGSLDASFGTSGLVMTPVSSTSDEARSVVIQSDGKIILAGYASIAFAFARYNSNGTLDNSFDGDGRATVSFGTNTYQAMGLALQADGKLVATGFAGESDGNNSALVRLNSNGSVDTSFDLDGRLTTKIGNFSVSATDIGLQPDGKIVMAGVLLFPVNGEFAVARLNPDGTLDDSFDGDGRVTTNIGSRTDEAQAVAIQSDSKIIAAGYSNNGTIDNFALVRYNTDGSLDTTFGTGGRVVTTVGPGQSRIWDVVLLPDGKILAAGTAFGFALARYNADGSLDTTFGTNGIVRITVGLGAQINDVVIQPDGKIVAAGNAFIVNEDVAVARFNTDGSLDTTFATNGIFTSPVFSGSDFLASVVLQPDGKIAASGSAYNGTFFEIAVIRLSSSGVIDNTFGGDGIVTTQPGGSVSHSLDLAIQPDGKIVAAGWAIFGSNPDFVAVRYNPDGSLDSSLRFGSETDSFGNGGIARADLHPTGDSAAVMEFQPDGRILLGGDSDRTFGIARLQNAFPPTVALVSVSGRVTTANGNGIRGVRLTLTAPDGTQRTATTSTFGYYTFDGIEVGHTYVLEVASKRYTFANPTRVFSLQDKITDMNFTADPQ